jgi:histidine triad (HIT) family protein
MGRPFMSCLFCKIAQKEIPAQIIYENDQIMAFDDINPQAPQHKIIIPKEHIATLNDLDEHHAEVVGKMVSSAKIIASSLGIADSGYRLVFNCNSQGGQTVFHLHLHLLGGRQFTWPPG